MGAAWPGMGSVSRGAVMQAAQINETLSTCRFAQRMMHVSVEAQRNVGSTASVHGNLMKLDPLMQQYLEARRLL